MYTHIYIYIYIRRLSIARACGTRRHQSTYYRPVSHLAAITASSSNSARPSSSRQPGKLSIHQIVINLIMQVTRQLAASAPPHPPALTRRPQAHIRLPSNSRKYFVMGFFNGFLLHLYWACDLCWICIGFMLDLYWICIGSPLDL